MVFNIYAAIRAHKETNAAARAIIFGYYGGRKHAAFIQCFIKSYIFFRAKNDTVLATFTSLSIYRYFSH